jgi:hypothetical protein
MRTRSRWIGIAIALALIVGGSTLDSDAGGEISVTVQQLFRAGVTASGGQGDTRGGRV